MWFTIFLNFFKGDVKENLNYLNGVYFGQYDVILHGLVTSNCEKMVIIQWVIEKDWNTFWVSNIFHDFVILSRLPQLVNYNNNMTFPINNIFS